MRQKPGPGRALPAAALLLAAALAWGCVAALHEPPPLAELAATDQVPQEAAATALQAEAQSLFQRRQPDPARQAIRLLLQASLNEASRRQALVEAVRILLWLIEHEGDAAAREAAAIKAVDAGIWCRRTAPQDTACDYWLGAALGVQARERRRTGYSALPEIEAAFTRVATAAPELEHAAADRSLAYLYLEAPGWPTGPGDPDLGLVHARQAVDRFPDYPPNLLVLADALQATGDDDAARAAWQQAAVAARRMAAGGDPDGPEWLADAESALADAETD